MAECEYFVRSWRKPETLPKLLCSLTGKSCFCDEFYLTCTRRTFALKYEQKRQGLIAIEPQTT